MPIRPLPLLGVGFAVAIATATFSCRRQDPPGGDGPATSQTAGGAAPAPAATASAASPRGNAAADGAAGRLRLLISGSMQGRLEPCGCASGQLGGLPRRIQHIGEQRDYDLLIEGGDLMAGATELDLHKFFAAVQILFGAHPYDALGIGPRDLLLPRAEWNAGLAGSPAIASNLRSKAADWPGKPFVDKTVRGVGVRIASLLLALPPELTDDTIELLPPAAAWATAMAGTAADGRRILLVHGDEAPIRALVPTLEPKPDLVIGVDAAVTEPQTLAQDIGGVPLVWSGIRGRVLLDVSLLREDGRPRAICTLVPLQGSKTVPGGGGDPGVRQQLKMHREDVKANDVLTNMARQLPTKNGASYVGTATCAGCHPTAAAAWKNSKHAHAWQTLVDAEADPKRYGWPVTAYPDCVSCHVVGYREKTGFVNATDTPQLADVGCERCHGAGSDHVQSGGQKKLGMIGGIAPSLLCVECHDFEQSPNFLYGDKWPLIQHGREPK